MTQIGTAPTFGEEAVGLTFNPSGDMAVHKCKAGFAALIDQMDELCNLPHRLGRHEAPRLHRHHGDGKRPDARGQGPHVARLSD